MSGHDNAMFIHVTYVPFIKAAGELKTKPTQQSVAKLREIGITPHILVCRCEKPLDKELRQKISLFCNVPYEAVIEEKDVDHSHLRSAADAAARAHGRSRLPPACTWIRRRPNMSHWQEIIRKLIAPQHRVRIGVVGKYIELQDAYKSVYEAIIHGGIANDCGVEIEKIDAEEIEKFGRGKDAERTGRHSGARRFRRARHRRQRSWRRNTRARTRCLISGLCLGMQIATIEFARNVLKLEKAHSTEFDPNTPHPVIAMLDEQKKVTKKGGTMRLGAQPCQLVVGIARPASFTARSSSTNGIGIATNSTTPIASKFEEAPASFSAALSPDGKLVEIIELKDHPFFIASQFHPEFQSKPNQPHPLVQRLHRRVPQLHSSPAAVIKKAAEPSECGQFCGLRAPDFRAMMS